MDAVARVAIPLLEYAPITQNSLRSGVPNLRVGSDEGSRAYSLEIADDRDNFDTVVEAGYRQIFFHAFKTDRDVNLESQLKDGQITVRDFIRGLLLSERFQQGYYQCNTNYRMVDQVVGRVLGRPVHGGAERRAWSIVIGEKGFTAFVDALLDSSEYMDSFGYDLVPQQRSRVLPGRALGEMPIYQHFPRYGADWRDALQSRAPIDQAAQMQHLKTSAAWVNGQPPAFALRIWLGLALVGGFELVRVVLTIALAMAKS